MATASKKHIPQKGAAAVAPTVAQTASKVAPITTDKVASNVAEAARGVVSKAGQAASVAAKQAHAATQAAAQAAAQGAAQVTKAAAAKAAIPVAKLVQKLGGDGFPAAEAAPKTLKSVDAAEKGVVAPKPLEESEFAFEEEEKEGPNRTLICTSFMVYVLFVATSVVFAEYSFQNYDLDPTDIRTHAPPLGTEKDNMTTAHLVHRRLPIRRHRNDTNIPFLEREPVEKEPEFDWDALRLGEMLSEEYMPEVLSNQPQRARGSGSASRLVQHAPRLRNGEEDYVPEILGD